MQKGMLTFLFIVSGPSVFAQSQVAPSSMSNTLWVQLFAKAVVAAIVTGCFGVYLAKQQMKRLDHEISSNCSPRLTASFSA
jgi:hypothetical protein